jgi:hypothetical protein
MKGCRYAYRRCGPPRRRLDGYRDLILRQFPGTFSVPPRYEKHMMVVADLASGDVGAIEDALAAAWRFQRDAD